MNVIIATLQLFLMISVFLYEYKRKSPALFLWAVLLFLFGFSHFFTVLGIITTNYSDDVLFIASMFSLIFSSTYLFIRLLTKQRRIIYQSSENILQSKFLGKILMILLCFVVTIQLYDIYKYSGSFLESSWSLRREMNAENSSFSLGFLSGYFYYTFASALLLFIVQKKKKLALITLCVLLIYSLISRQRISLLPIFISFLSYPIVSNKKLNIKTIFLFLFVGFISIYSIFALQLFRYGGSISNFLSDFNINSFSQDVLERISSGEGEFMLRDAFYFFIDHNNNFENFGEGHTYLRLLMFFVPSQWSLGIKPPDFAISMGTAWNPGVSGFSMHPTLLGDLYANFDFWGAILGGTIWAGIVNITDRVIRKSPTYLKISFFLTASCQFVIVGRGSVYNALVAMIYSMLFLWLLHKLYLKKYERKHSFIL